MEMSSITMVKKKILELLATRGLFLSRCIDVQTLKRLIERMHPRTTRFDLIRVGGETDGGYLVPDDLEGIVGCFSPGVDVVASFEAAIVARGIPCFLADASVTGPPIANSLIHFDQKFLGVVDDSLTTTMDTWVKTYAPPTGDLILQMDIEGAEWPVLLNVSDETLGRFRIIVLELHSLERLLDQVGFNFIFASLDRLLRRYHVVHLHPNNLVSPVNASGLAIPRLLEVTLLRHDRGQPTGYANRFPHPLDRRNLADRRDYILPECWFRSAN
jgi:hypothetical protein